jgi:hypothetical protein
MLKQKMLQLVSSAKINPEVLDQKLHITISFEKDSDLKELFQPETYSTVIESTIREGDETHKYMINGNDASITDIEITNERIREGIRKSDTILRSRIHERLNRFLRSQRVFNAEEIINDVKTRSILLIATDLRKIISVVKRHKSEFSHIDLVPTRTLALNDVILKTNVKKFAHGYGLRGENVGVWVNEEAPDIYSRPGALPLLNGRIKVISMEAVKSAHNTFMSLIIGSNDPVYTGIAPQSYIYAGTVAGPLNKIFDFECGQVLPGIPPSCKPSVYIANNSWFIGGPDSKYIWLSEQWDDFVYDYRTFISQASANLWKDKNGKDIGGNPIGVPSNAYNVMSVGGWIVHNDSKNDYTHGAVCPVGSAASKHHDRIKPEVIAPTNGIRATKNMEAGGVSTSTAIVSGIAADVMTNPWYRNRPEAVKAVIMAGATNEVQLKNDTNGLSDIRIGAGVHIVNQYGDTWQEGDGPKYSVGGVNFLNTYFYRWTGYYEGGNNAFFDSYGRFTTEHFFLENERYRIVLVWSTRGEYARISQQPDKDLDLYLVDETGKTLARSISYDNTYEIIDFVPSKTMNKANVVINRYRNDGDSIKMALSVGQVN